MGSKNQTQQMEISFTKKKKGETELAVQGKREGSEKRLKTELK